ncbi:ygbK domain-containing protein, partial [Klebsiella pneumoniae]
SWSPAVPASPSASPATGRSAMAPGGKALRPACRWPVRRWCSRAPAR